MLVVGNKGHVDPFLWLVVLPYQYAEVNATV